MSQCRYVGTDPEPRPGLSSGHMPHSFSLPFNVFLQKHRSKQGSEYTTFLASSEIQNALEAAVRPIEFEKILKGERPVVTSCGSGMTAGVLWLGLQLLGVQKVSLYDEVMLNGLFRRLFFSSSFTVVDRICYETF